MTHTYHVAGMTCGSCESIVKSNLLSVPGVLSAEVSKERSTAVITMDDHVPLSELQEALGGPASKYQISAPHHSETAEQAKSVLKTYRPILLIFLFITGVSLLVQIGQPFSMMEWMRHFMAGFFLVFSFFKFLDLQGFSESYRMYDIVAKRVKVWGYLYPFTELALGIAYLLNFDPLITNSVTLVVMLVSSIGVLQSVLDKRKIRCACLGAVFDLPMSTVTIIEDLLMVAMSVAMLLLMA